MNGIRVAEVMDASGILAIYGPIVRETTISMEVEPPSIEQMQGRILNTASAFPWLVCTQGDSLLGYAYASRHRERAAYQWSADVSVYVAAHSRRSGVGRALYAVLLGMLADLGYYSALAGIGLPNAGSVGLHEAMRFRPIGVYRNIGYKLGAWRDVGWWQRELQPYGAEPQPPRKMSEYAGSEAMKKRLAS